MEFDTIVHERYATKKFDGRTVPEETISKLKDMIRFSASSWNIQPWKIYIVKDSELKEQLLPASYNQEQITSCSHLFVFCADTDLMSLADKLSEHITNESYMDMIRQSLQSKVGADALRYASNQVYIALGNALNGAKSLGLDSCPMEGFDPAQYSEILDLPENQVPVVLCPVGYAADEPRDKLRFDDIFVEK